jgi:hypothetical protein
MEADYISDDDSVDSDTSSDNDDDDDIDRQREEVNINNMKMPTSGKANKLGKQLIQAMDEDSSSVTEDSLNELSKTNEQG